MGLHQTLKLLDALTLDVDVSGVYKLPGLHSQDHSIPQGFKGRAYSLVQELSATSLLLPHSPVGHSKPIAYPPSLRYTTRPLPVSISPPILLEDFLQMAPRTPYLHSLPPTTMPLFILFHTSISFFLLRKKDFSSQW